MPTAGPGEIIVKNAAIAPNHLDQHMQEHGVFVQQWPAIFGCDVAGIVHEVGSGVERFKKGDRVIGHTINPVSGRPQDGAFALYTVVPTDKAAILPDNIPFVEGVVLPLALEAAICALCVKEPGEALPGVLTPALGLPYPTVHPQPPLNKTLLVNGGSSAVGSMIAQLAIAIGLDVVLISAHTSITSSLPSERITEFLTSRDSTNVEDIISHITQSNNKFIGIFDAISIPSTYELDLKILKALGGGQLACTHPPPKDLPKDVAAGMIFAVNDVVTPVWREFVTPALETGMLKCILTPTVIGKGLEFVQEELDMLKSGVHDTKLVVEL